jgi:putative methionine-R-sulfoxide reductase with GAF domain
MTDLFKDGYKLSLLLATLFAIGVMASFYQIYRLPHNLMLADGYQPVMLNVYLIPGITFLIGAFAVWVGINYKNEVIVYRDKQLQADVSARENADANLSTISLDPVKDSLKQVSGEKNITQSALHAICKQLSAGQGAIYLLKEEEGKRKLILSSGYALNIAESAVISFEIGEGLVGQAAATGKTLYVDDVPDGYVKIISGLGSASPRYLMIAILKHQDAVLGAMEIASFSAFQDHQRKFIEDSAQLIADKISSR